jgi:hypothetical protein
MARILAIPMSWGRGSGPLVDILTIGQGALAGGHEFGVACKPSFRDRAADADMDVVGELPERRLKDIDDEFFSDFAAFQGLAEPEYVRSILKAEASVVERWRPDVLLGVLQPTLQITAWEFQRPLVTNARWTEHPNFDSEATSLATPVFNDILKSLNREPIRDVWDLSFWHSDAGYAIGFPELEPNLKWERTLLFVRQATLALKAQSNAAIDGIRQAWTKADPPRAYVYLSHKDVTLNDLSTGLELAAEEGWAILCSGDLSFQPRRANLMSASWVDASLAVQTADVVVSLGMKGTVLSALENGAGLVLLRSSDEELGYIAGRLSELGLAIVCSVQDFNRSPLNYLLSAITLSKQQNAKALRKELSLMPGPDAVIDLCASLVT